MSNEASGPLPDPPPGPPAGRSGIDACAALAELAAREALARPSPRGLVRRLAREGAGVRPGLHGILDLLTAGRDGLPGRGFRAELDDGTDGQVRHFCGIAASCDRFGGRPTRWVSIHVRRDAADAPDGRLTDLAIEFVALLYRGELDVGDASDWLRRTLCAPAADRDADRGADPDGRPAPPA